MAASRAEEMLVKRGVRPTPQRVVITDFILSTECHPTAEEVLAAVAGSLPVALSRATVYNTLNTLVQAGVIKEVFTEPGRTRYDANVSEHHHFVDLRTGRIYDIESDCLPQCPERLDRRFKVRNYQVTFYGEVEEA